MCYYSLQHHSLRTNQSHIACAVIFQLNLALPVGAVLIHSLQSSLSWASSLVLHTSHIHIIYHPKGFWKRVNSSWLKLKRPNRCFVFCTVLYAIVLFVNVEIQQACYSTGLSINQSIIMLTPGLSRPSTWSAKNSCCRSNGITSSDRQDLGNHRYLCTSETISYLRHALFGHVARLPDDAPTHKALSVKSGQPASSQWHCHWGCPRNRWVDQIQSDNNLPPADPCRRAVSRGYRGAMLRPLRAKW